MLFTDLTSSLYRQYINLIHIYLYTLYVLQHIFHIGYFERKILI